MTSRRCSASSRCGRRFFHLRCLVWALDEEPRDDRKIKAIKKERIGAVRAWNVA